MPGLPLERTVPDPRFQIPDSRFTLRPVLAVVAAAAVACSGNPPPATGGSRPGDFIARQAGARAVSTEAASITEASIRSHMEFLASDALNGRGSGTREEWMAAEYIGSQFSSWGLEPMGDAGGFVQQIALADFDVTGPAVIEAGDLRLTHGREMLVWSVSRPVTSGQLIKYAGEESVPMGTILLLPEGRAATPVAGASMLIALATERETSQWDERASRPLRMPTEITKLAAAPAARPTIVYVTPETHAALGALFDRTVVTLSVPIGEPRRSYTWNVVGKLTGSNSIAADEVLVLGAHLDHVGSRGTEGDTIYNGADDDASGTVAVMELARAIASGPRPRRSVVFALFGSEERGGLGARYFVGLPVVPLDRMVAQIQFEMIGRPDAAIEAETLWLTGYERSNLGSALAARGARLVADPHPDENFFQRSDNIQFARAGVVAHTVSSFGLHEDYHRPSDEIDTIDFAHMTMAIRSMLEPIRWLAGSEFKPAWNPGGKPN